MPELYVGLMSGTSLDGIDAVLSDETEDASRLVHRHYTPFVPALREALLALNEEGGHDELRRAALAANDLARVYAQAVQSLLSEARIVPRAIAALGCHGQTVRHDPASGYTTQLVNGALLAELTGICTVCDFRSRDVAAGGQGAPLVPAFHHARFFHPGIHRVIVNVGGIANVTDLPPAGGVTGFDCGPGNVLLDAWIAARTGRLYDENGDWASGGHVDQALLARLAEHAYFAQRPPKSTGRDAFNLAWLERMLSGKETAADVQATLLELTATTIAAAITAHCEGAREVYVCGGGARNGALMNRLSRLLTGVAVSTTDRLGVEAEWVEAAAFAWLAHRTLRGEAGNVPGVTGAAGPRVLGAIYPA
jgi:anhydro-N-acetylmuramic acid kinase